MSSANPDDANIPTIPKGSLGQTCGQKNMQILFLGINGSPGLVEQLWTEEGKNSPLALTEQIVMFKF